MAPASVKHFPGGVHRLLIRRHLCCTNMAVKLMSACHAIQLLPSRNISSKLVLEVHASTELYKVQSMREV